MQLGSRIDSIASATVPFFGHFFPRDRFIMYESFFRVHSTERFIQQVRVNEWIVIEFEYSFL